jgi:putative transposase
VLFALALELMKQQSFFKLPSKHRHCSGGRLRNLKAGRGVRKLSRKEPLHAVFKAHKQMLKSGLRTHANFRLATNIIQNYAKKFYVKLEQVSIQNDHIHFVIRTSRRTNFHAFFRVVAGQIAQQLGNLGRLVIPKRPLPKNERRLWKYRPFSRVVFGRKGFNTAMNYVRLNELEALGKIPYRKERLRGLSPPEWEMLWS